MAAPKHQPPSRRRYAERHPTIGVHCDERTYDTLLGLREISGLSFGQLVRQALGVLEMDVEAVEAHVAEESDREGYARAKAEYCLSAPCKVCGQAMEIRAGSAMAKAAIAALSDWGHSACFPPTTGAR